MKRLLFAPVLLLTLSSQLFSQTVSAPESSHSPVIVFLRMRASDSINIEMTENRIQRTLQLLEALKSQYPSVNVKATIFVNGAVSDLLLQRNSQTGVRDLLLADAKKGLIEIGYDGSDEPRSSDQPLVDYRDVSTPKENYLARQAVAERVLTDGRDPMTGKYMPDADGGLKKMQQVFGKAASIRGAGIYLKDLTFGAQPDFGSDAEMVQQIGLLNSTATLPGVIEDIPHLDFYYDDWIPVYSKHLSSSADASPDIYWQENRLRISERGDKPSKVVEAAEGVDALKDYLDKLDRSKIRVVQIEIGNDKGYLQPAYRSYLIYPPQTYASKHPQAPKLPANAFGPEAEVTASFEKEKDTLEYLLANFLSKNPYSRVAASGDLLNMTSPCAGYRVSVASLRKALVDMDKSWGDGTFLPKYVKVDEHYLSLAQTFQVLASGLVERRRAKKLPDAIEVLNVHGPIDMPTGTGAAKTEVSANDVDLAAVYILPGLYEEMWTPLPRNTVPGQVQIGTVTVNGAQYLRLMIGSFLADDPKVKLTVQPTGMIWAPEAVAIRTRAIAEMGTIWTIKPAPLNLGEASKSVK